MCHSDEAAYNKLLLAGTIVGNMRGDSGGAQTGAVLLSQERSNSNSKPQCKAMSHKQSV